MHHELQTGWPELSIHYSQAAKTWFWTCLFGCQEWGYRSHEEATEAFLGHTCN